MKRFLLTFAALALLAGGAFAATYSTLNYNEPGGGRLVIGGDLDIVSGGEINFEAGSTLDTSGVTFSTDVSGNPLLQTHFDTVTTAEANTGHLILASATGKVIYPGAGLSIYASGTAGGATNVGIKCGGGDTIATFPIAMLTDDVPVGVFSSAGGATTTRGVSLTDGCPSGEGIMVITSGTLTTTTHLFINLPYVVQ